MSCKISIVTVCLNNLEGLKKTAESINRQTFEDFEWIVVDGKSTDGTCSYLSKTGVNCRFVSEEDSGIYDAMNKGINMADGNYLLFLNSGDYLYDRNVLSNVVEYLKGDLIIGKIQWVFPLEKSRKPEIKDFSKQDIRKKFIYHKTLPHPSSFFSKDLFTKYGFYDSRYKICGDYDFYTRVIKSGVTVTCVPICVSVFSVDGISSRLFGTEIIKQEQKRVIRENFSLSYRLKRTVIDVVEDWLKINQVR